MTVATTGPAAPATAASGAHPSRAKAPTQPFDLLMEIATADDLPGPSEASDDSAPDEAEAEDNPIPLFALPPQPAMPFPGNFTPVAAASSVSLANPPKEITKPDPVANRHADAPPGDVANPASPAADPAHDVAKPQPPPAARPANRPSPDRESGGETGPNSGSSAPAPTPAQNGTGISPPTPFRLEPPADTISPPQPAAPDIKAPPDPLRVPTVIEPPPAEAIPETGISIEIGAGDRLDIRIGATDADIADKVSSEIDLLRQDLVAIGSEVEAIRVEVRNERGPNPPEALPPPRHGTGDAAQQQSQRQPPQGPSAEQERQGRNMHRIQPGDSRRIEQAPAMAGVDRYA